MTKESKAALRDRQRKVDAYVSKDGQRSAQRYLDAHPQPLHNWTAIGQAIVGAIAVLLFLYFLFA